jgi:hypothetical protein
MIVSRGRAAAIAALAALLLTASAAPAAHASKFAVAEYPATLSGSQVAGETVTLSFGTSGSASCKTHNVTGSLPAMSESIELLPTFKSTCTVFGDAKGSITTTGCDLKIYAGAPLGGPKFEGSTDVVCSVGSSIKIVGSTCELEIKPVKSLGKLELIDNGKTPAEVVIKFNLSSVPYTVTTDGVTCPLPSVGNYTNATYVGAVQVGATSNSGPVEFLVL